MNGFSQKVILLVEDERITAKTVTHTLEKHGYLVIHASTGEEAVITAGNCGKLDLLLTDIDLGGGMDGTLAAEEILKIRNIPALFLSGHTEPEFVEKTGKIISYGYIAKNTGETVLIASISMAFKLFEAHEKINSQKLELEISAREMEAALKKIEAKNRDLIIAQKQLIESEGRYRRLHESMTDAYAMVDMNGKIIESNKSFQELTGYSGEELSKLTYEEITPEVWHEGEKQYIIKTIRSIGNASPYEKEFIRKDGSVVPVEIRLFALFDDNKNMHALWAIVRDITERKNAEKLMAEANLMLQLVLDTIPSRIFWKGLDFKYSGCNRLVAMDAGLPSTEQLIGLDDFDLPWKEQAEKYRADDIDIITSGEGKINYEERLTRFDGNTLWLSTTKVPLKDIEGKTIGILGTWEDITEKKNVISALEISEERFRSIIQSSSDMIFIIGGNGLVSYESPSVTVILGYPEGFFIGKSPYMLINPDDLNIVTREMKLVSSYSNDGQPTEFRLKKADNSWVYLEAIATNLLENPAVNGIVVTARDITERKKTQEILIQSEKMITVAGLAAGMAHEINNPLGIIMQSAENAKNRIFGEFAGNTKAAAEAGTDIQSIHKYATSRKINSYLDDIHEAGTRAAKIIGNMLQFSRSSESGFSYLRINNIIDKAIDLGMNDYDLKKKYDVKKIRFIKDYGDLPVIKCQETQIEQVFLNIFKNAAQALGSRHFSENEIPTITITTRSLNGSNRIEISDNGPGMSDEVRNKIFEPFFTTKEPGSGTGLGLSVSFYIIVNGHGGTISAESELNNGSTFIITLPETAGNI